MIDISYVITVYNKAKYMGPMLNALERQSGSFSCEYIFVNDGSTDNSLEIIRERTKDWPNVRIIDQVNSGVSVATNVGGFEARGEFIKLVDGDDAMTHFASRRMLEMMRDHHLDRLEAGWALSDDQDRDVACALDESGDVEIVQEPMKVFFKSGMGCSTSTMIRTSAFKDVGGCDERVFVQDFSLPLRLSRKYRFGRTHMLTVFGPRSAEGRILDAQATVIHDVSATMGHFLVDHPEIAPHLQRLAFKRCAGRAWKWARREQGKSIFCREFYLYVLSLLPVWSKTGSWIEKTLQTWEGENVRRPKKAGQSSPIRQV